MQWISTHAKQQWLKLVFSICAGLFTWWYVHETQVSTRVFPEVYIWVQGLPQGKTILGLRKDGRLMRQISLTLKGRKSTLDKINNEQLEVVVNASNKGDVWKEELTTNELRCLNPNVKLERDIYHIEHNPLQIRLMTKVSRDVPVTILPPTGNLPKGYKLIDIWPQRLSQQVDGPEETVQALSSRRLFLPFDLNRITKQQLERSSDELTPGSEIYLKVPDSWKYVELPAPIGESRQLDDPDAENLTLVILKPALLKIDQPFPIRISPLPLPTEGSPIINRAMTLTANSKQIIPINGLYFWNRPVYIEGVSKEFLETILPSLELVIYIGTTGHITSQIEIANLSRAERKYVQKTMQHHFERSGDPEESIQKHLSQQFWRYVSQMSFYGEAKRRFELDTVTDKTTLIIKENE